MNRQILFRGKRNGKWFYGYYNYCTINDIHEIISEKYGCIGIEVEKETIGQFTSRLDNSGKKIFEQDKVIYLGLKGFVFYSDEYSMFMVRFENGSEYSFDSISSLIKIIK